MCDSMQGIHRSMQDDVAFEASQNSPSPFKHLTFTELLLSNIKLLQPRKVDAAVVCHCIY